MLSFASSKLANSGIARSIRTQIITPHLQKLKANTFNHSKIPIPSPKKLPSTTSKLTISQHPKTALMATRPPRPAVMTERPATGNPKKFRQRRRKTASDELARLWDIVDHNETIMGESADINDRRSAVPTHFGREGYLPIIDLHLGISYQGAPLTRKSIRNYTVTEWQALFQWHNWPDNAAWSAARSAQYYRCKLGISDQSNE